MVSLDVIEREIGELEARGETTYALCERLAILYTCRDHLLPAREAATLELSGSDFLEACNGVPLGKLMAVLDEHMEAMRVIGGREYMAVMDKIRALKE